MSLLIFLAISRVVFCDETIRLQSGIVKSRHAQSNARPDFVTKMDAHIYIDRAEIFPGGDVKEFWVEIRSFDTGKSWNTSHATSNYNPFWGETYTAVNIQNSFFDTVSFYLHSYIVVHETVASNSPTYSSYPIGLDDSAMEFRNITLVPITNNATLWFGAIGVCTLTECTSRTPVSSTCSSVLDTPDKACYKVGSKCSLCSSTTCSSCNSPDSCSALSADCDYIQSSCTNITSYCSGTSCSTCNSPSSCSALSADCDYIQSSCTNITSYCSGTSCSTCNSPSSCRALSGDCDYIQSSCTNITSYCSGNSCSTCNSPDSCSTLSGDCDFIQSSCTNLTSYCSGTSCSMCNSASSCRALNSDCSYIASSCVNITSYCSGNTCISCSSKSACGSKDNSCVWDNESCIEKESNSSLFSDKSIKFTFQGFWFLVIGVPMIFLVIVVGLIIGCVWCRYRARGGKRDGYTSGPNKIAQELVD